VRNEIAKEIKVRNGRQKLPFNHYHTFITLQSEKLTVDSCVVSEAATDVYTTMKPNSKEVHEKRSIAESYILQHCKVKNLLLLLVLPLRQLPMCILL